MALFNWPMPASAYTVSQPYKGAAHQGMDLAAPLGTPYYASADGTVVAAGPASGFGHWIVINHAVFYNFQGIGGTQFSTVYGHSYAKDIFVHPGQKVNQGDKIGLVGADGNSTGAHLHFEVWEGYRLAGGHSVDPAKVGMGNFGDSNITGQPTGSPIEAAASGIESVVTFIKSIGDLIAFLTDPKNWVRVSLATLGSVLIIVGLWGAIKKGQAITVTLSQVGRKAIPNAG